MGFLKLVCFSLLTIQVFSKPTDDQFVFEAQDDGFIFEGDMVLPKESIKNALNGNINPDKGAGYSLLRALHKRWPNGVVPYVMDSSVKNRVLNIVGFKGPTEAAIRKAMDAWEKKTCIRFVEKSKENDYVKIIDAGFGKCYSHVGRNGGAQSLSLGFGCFTKGIAIHELGHALGLYHEQSRPDRDDYVTIVWDNIKQDNKHNFKKYDTGLIDSRGSPYDYDSIMHYKWNEFAKIPLIQTTIRTKKDGVSFGQRDHISVEDANQINKYYNLLMLKASSLNSALTENSTAIVDILNNIIVIRENRILNIVGFKGPTERAIRNAMDAWEKLTCIKFIERKDQKDYVKFIDDGFGDCWSHVGRKGGRQKLSLGFGCFTTGTAIHELGHVLGLHHEQSRPDRDNYVTILWDNIKSDNKHNFRKYSRGDINSHGSPYDYDSIMHYGWNAFAKIPLIQATMKSKKDGVSFGQRDHISTQDAFQINQHYNCKI